MTAEDANPVQKLDAAIERLRPLHTTLGKPRPGDWLAQHRETGQTFAQYLAAFPTRPSGKRTVIWIQPLGDFTPEQRKIVRLTAGLMSGFYNMPVKIKEDIPLSAVPARARRAHPQWGVKQILSTYVLDEILLPRLPEDAAVYLAFTASDLWPGEGWNFVFGQASLRERVGVWSIARNGDPAADEAGFRLCLLRTLKTAVHETGHMFSMEHCTLYECGMCGSNHREESDRQPLWFCPECTAKVCWATGTQPAEHYRRLLAFCAEQGLKAEEEFCRKSLKTLGEPAPAAPPPAKERP